MFLTLELDKTEAFISSNVFDKSFSIGRLSIVSNKFFISADKAIDKSSKPPEDLSFVFSVKNLYIELSIASIGPNAVSFGSKLPSLLNNALEVVLSVILEIPYKAPRIGLSLSLIFSNTGNKVSDGLDSIAFCIV